MNVTTIKIGGRDVEVPHGEIPQLIKELTAIYAKALVSSDISAPKREGFVTYEECEKILSALYTDKMLRYHTGRLWGAMCNAARFKKIPFYALCTVCNSEVDEVGEVNGRRCFHCHTSTGHRATLIGRASIFENFTRMKAYRSSTVGESISQDFLYFVDGLKNDK